MYNPHDQIKVKIVTSTNGDRKTNMNLTEKKSKTPIRDKHDITMTVINF